MLLQGVAGWAVTHHKNMQVKPCMVQGYEVDQLMDRVPAANKAGEAQDQARRQAKSRLGGADVSIGGNRSGSMPFGMTVMEDRRTP